MQRQPVYDNYEISGCRRCNEDEKDERQYVETCEDAQAQFWTLYGHLEGQGVEAIGDFNSRHAAEQVFYRVTRQPFTASYEASQRLRLMHAAPALLSACRMVVARWDRGDLAEAARACSDAIAIATDVLPPTSPSIEITEDEFDSRFPLVTNHFDPNASWGLDKEGGCLFETYGEELEFVRQQDPSTVWTLVDGDYGDLYLQRGFHVVNRIGYLISTVPVPEGTDIQVHIPMENPDDAETDHAEEE